MKTHTTTKERKLINDAWSALLHIADQCRMGDSDQLKEALKAYNRGRDNQPLSKLFLVKAAMDAQTIPFGDLWAYDAGFRSVVLFAVHNSGKLVDLRSQYRKSINTLSQTLIERKMQ